MSVKTDTLNWNLCPGFTQCDWTSFLAPFGSQPTRKNIFNCILICNFGHIAHYYIYLQSNMYLHAFCHLSFQEWCNLLLFIHYRPLHIQYWWHYCVLRVCTWWYSQSSQNAKSSEICEYSICNCIASYFSHFCHPNNKRTFQINKRCSMQADVFFIIIIWFISLEICELAYAL